MPRHTFLVSSTEIVHFPETVDAEGFRTPAYDVKSIRCKVPKDDMRPWGRQLYAFLGILFVPVLFDSFWKALFNHYRYQLELDDDKTYSTFREWVSRPRNILLLPITVPFVVYFTVGHAVTEVVIAILNAFIPFRCTPQRMRFPFATRDPLLPGMLACQLLCLPMGVSPFGEFPCFNSYVSKTAEKNDDEDNWEFIVTTDPAYDIAVDQYFKMRFPPFMYWCFLRGNSLAVEGNMESQV